MTGQVRFAPGLGDWIQRQLHQGQSPEALVEVLQEREVALPAAEAIVAAFVRARLGKSPLPVDRVDLPGAVQAQGDLSSRYRHEAPRLAPGASIDAGDRVVRAVARAGLPALAVLEGVLDSGECEQLIALARGRLKPSTVTEPATGRDVVARQRSSFGMFFLPFENPLVASLDRRFSRLMNLPAEHGEGLQVLYYPQGAGSEPHFDFLVPSNDANRASIARSGQRVSTLVAYLNDVSEGGETVFPEVGWAISPVRGNAVHFEYCNSLGQVDPASLHASRAVQRGEKWVATKWMRSRPFVSA
jgi:prolyl 4-hydroxylase